MVLKTKCIYAPIEPEDGYRIVVMSRLTLSDGKTPDPRITPDKYNDWWRDIAPSGKLVGSWYRKEIKWEEFERGYEEHLHEQISAQCVRELMSRSKKEDITILCCEETPEHCHRRLLAEHCKKLCPMLEVIIR